MLLVSFLPTLPNARPDRESSQHGNFPAGCVALRVMARVHLDIKDLPNRMALKALLEREGHDLQSGASAPQVVITDSPLQVNEYSREAAVLIATTSGDAALAVDAMRRGAFGYILLPLLPNEAALMVERAMLFAHAVTSPRGMDNDDDEIVPLTLEEVEDVHILDTMRRCRNNQARAARDLGIGRNTLWRKLKRIQAKMARPEI